MSGSFRWVRVALTAAVLIFIGVWTSAQDDLGEIEALLRDLEGDAEPAAAAAELEVEAPVAEAPIAEVEIEAEPAIEIQAIEPAAEVLAAEEVIEAPVAEIVAPAVEEMAEVPVPEDIIEAPVAEVTAPAVEEVAEVFVPDVVEAPATEGEVPVAEAVAADVPVVEAVAPADVPETVASEKDTRVSELVTLERMRRQAMIEHGRDANLLAGQNAIKAANFEDAKLQFEHALQYIPETPDTLELRKEASAGLAEAHYQHALVLRKKGLLEQALAEARIAQEKNQAQANRLVAQIQKELETPPRKEEVVEIPRLHQLDYKEDREQVALRLRRARQHYIVGEYDKARDEVELVIKDHRFDTEAIRLLRRIAERMHEVSTQEQLTTRERMLREVTATWTPDRYGMDTSVSVDTQTIRDKPDQILKPVTGGLSLEQEIQKKMQAIVIPEINFRNANITDVITFFETASREYDSPDTPPEKRGVNFVLKTVGGSAPAAAPQMSLDPFASAVSPGGSDNAGGVPITFTARFVTLFDALKTVMDVSNMKFRIKGTIVTIMSANIPDDDVITRSYNVLPTLTERVLQTSREMSTRGDFDSGFGVTTDMSQTTDWKGFFGEMGVPWPEGSAISYLSTIGKLRVSNTADNLANFEQVLEELNVTPRQIEIEARFVEVAQEDLNSLGFEWMLQGNVAINTGIGSLDTLQNAAYSANNVLGGSLLNPGQKGNLIVDGGGAGGSWVDTFIPGGTDPFTGQPLPGSTTKTWQWDSARPNRSFGRGMRFLNTPDNGIIPDQGMRNDDLLQLTAAIDGNALSMILHALSQQTSTDLLSAPKVVTKSGQEAIMKVVTEYIYPTEFEVKEGSGETSGRDSGGAAVNFPAVEPQNFVMREVGVILQVIPEVSAEGQMINLMMNPQVVSEPVWKDYGYESKTIVDGQEFTTHLPMEQPWFKVRSVSTSISIYNGATVVMGGMITEERVATFDKIPILGDIPYLGRFFQNKADRTQKRNLLIFVTARLVDPAGRPVKTVGETKMSEPLPDLAGVVVQP